MNRLPGALICAVSIASCSDDPQHAAARFGHDVVSTESFETHLALVGREHSSQETRDAILQERVEEEMLAMEAVKLGLDDEREVKERLALYRRKVLSQRYLNYLLRREVSDAQLKKEYLANEEEYSATMLLLRQLVIPEPGPADLARVGKAVEEGANLQQISKDLNRSHYLKEDELEAAWVADQLGEDVAHGAADDIKGPFKLGDEAVFVEIVKPGYEKVVPFAEVKRLLLERHRREVRQEAVQRIRNRMQASAAK